MLLLAVRKDSVSQMIVVLQVCPHLIGEFPHSVNIEAPCCQTVFIILKIIEFLGLKVHEGNSQPLYILPGNRSVGVIMSPPGVVGAFHHEQVNSFFLTELLDFGHIFHCRCCGLSRVVNLIPDHSVVLSIVVKCPGAFCVVSHIGLEKEGQVLSRQVVPVVIFQNREDITEKGKKLIGVRRLKLTHDIHLSRGCFRRQRDLIHGERQVIQCQSVVVTPFAGVRSGQEQSFYHNHPGVLCLESVLQGIIGCRHCLIGTSHVISCNPVLFIEKHRTHRSVHVTGPHKHDIY